MSRERPDGFVSLRSIRGTEPASPEDLLAEIRRIYFKTTRQTIDNDLAHAVELLKRLPDEQTRERAAVFMEGLAQMRRDWKSVKVKGQGQRAKVRAKGEVKVQGRRSRSKA